MSTMNIARQRRSLLSDGTVLDHLPAEILDIIKDQSNPKILDAVAEAALIPSLTERIFKHFQPAFPDICARWLLNSTGLSRQLIVLSALARVLIFAPHLAVFLEHSSSATLGNAPSLKLPLPAFQDILEANDHKVLLVYLLAIWRLINFDQRRFASHISPAFAQGLFAHQDRAVRYLAIRIFCQLLYASDHKTELLLTQHVGDDDVIIGDFDGKPVDYVFLSLHETVRVEDAKSHYRDLRSNNRRAERKALGQECTEQDWFECQEDEGDGFLEEPEPLLHALTPYAASHGNVLLPRPFGPTGDPAILVPTPTTEKNLETLARKLQTDQPILLHGLPGSGKTSLVHEIARELGMYSNMVTLHLNEQTDAKMLIGLYSTDSKPGSFQWRPGVLTTAVREGRWVLIEDLDRAPTEVLSTLLPLIERKELLIPSRGERIKAASSFRLFATLRTSRGMNGRENLPSIVGMRFWETLHTEPLKEAELEQVILQRYPILNKYLAGILAVHRRLSGLSSKPSFMTRGRNILGRSMNVRDLLKWCRRLVECLTTAGSVTGEEPISETTRDWMFMEALDCFVGSCPDMEVAKHVVYAIAEEMHMAKERAEHYLEANIPPFEDAEHQLKIGRVRLRKQRSKNRIQKSKRPFASTTHAKRLLEQIAAAVKLSEPVLLVGETGIGKTTVVQQLAESMGHKLIAVNLSQQSEVGDLLGGFKPVNMRSLAVPLKEEFEDLFAATGISASRNQKYLESVGKSFAKGQWTKVSKLWKEAPKMFSTIVSQMEKKRAEEAEAREGEDQPAKRRKTQSRLQTMLDLQPRWDAFSQKLEQFDVQSSGGANTFAFSFVEGNLVKAVRNGDWVLLDEINLASPDTLESIADLLSGPDERPSILLTETGEIEKVVAHPNFRIFGAMNPATDIGKRDLPGGIRSRFTELYVHSPDNDLKDLLSIIKTYLGSSSNKHDQAADDIARLYMNTKKLAEERRLVDGANEVPHFSLRTLTRVLSYVNTIAPTYGLRRALYEGFSMGFLTLLDRDSEKMLLPLIYHHIFDKQGDAHSLLSQPPKHPNDGKEYVRFKNKDRDRQYWLFRGEEPIVEREDYIVTPYVERNLLNLVRATSTRRFPILIQGPTSAGKTSMIEYLADFTGNKFVRINNHEHTDLQEYLGTYVSGPDGKLRFQEGLLVQAMRKGHWIVLDELNLAPTDVLEALNRLLDDNRELLIPETQEIVRPHENFILFATQNPPGLYGGRKVLSRAFRNRFLELHYDDIPEDELEFILQQRSRNTSPPDCRRIVNVYKELSRLRQTSRVFEQKGSFATLRDLFRWALREAESREEIAAHGFMLLAERVRNAEERQAVKEVIETVFKVKINPQELYSAEVAPELRQFSRMANSQGVIWTHAMRRLYVLLSRALKNNEPVLLVGETGCGKTTVVQLLAEALGQKLHIVNAHQNTETGDLIGSQRPVRNRGAILASLDIDVKLVLETLGVDNEGTAEERLQRYAALSGDQLQQIPEELRQRITANETRSKALFEWADGALVEAMREGQFFLLDEISLADDSVLERLNSVLEPQRTLLLAEKGVDDSFVKGSDGFQMFATMNPGGDFGKKELSPALRNRFTEIWVPPLSDSEDVYDIVSAKLGDGVKEFVEPMVLFATWFGETYRSMASTRFSIREILVWVQFVNASQSQHPLAALVHGAATIFVDSIGANPSAIMAVDSASIAEQRKRCLKKLGQLTGEAVDDLYVLEPKVTLTDDSLTIGDFSIGRTPMGSLDGSFAMFAPTTVLNAMRVLRALQMEKPILLEGSPGVGKTTLIAALARTCGQPLTRINLSDQTDLMDLFGTDVPVEGAEAGNFAWRDAPFLQAMQKGEWVLLDEMNLASQSVLEGLNACLDHRGEVYVSELDQVFKRHPNFRLFAAQNPHHQGGGRKGLPSSFVNRFVVVYADVFTPEDLFLIAEHNFPSIDQARIKQLIKFVSRLEDRIVNQRAFGSQGSPWEFNLRDVLRWLQLLSADDPLSKALCSGPSPYFDMIIRSRFRTHEDRKAVDDIWEQIMRVSSRKNDMYWNIGPSSAQIGYSMIQRNLDVQPQRLPNPVPRDLLSEAESVITCVNRNIPCILSGASGSGKTLILEFVAALAGKPLVVFPMNADIDTMDLVGGYEQSDPLREVNTMLRQLYEDLHKSIMTVLPGNAPEEALQLLHLLNTYTGQVENLPVIRRSMDTLISQVPADSQVASMLNHGIELLSRSLTVTDPRFEWLDGVIVKALQTGQWLVLDNANMCNASVLDRLNSLLEPNGFLSINEHCEPGGEPRMVRPHPDFRIFLTVDPRYGELSRAMRNRAVEIHLVGEPVHEPKETGKPGPVEPRLQRFCPLLEEVFNPDFQSYSLYSHVAADLLLLEDIPLLPRFAKDFRNRKASPLLEELVDFFQSPMGSNVVLDLSNLYSGVTAKFPNPQQLAKPVHAMGNHPLTQVFPDQGKICTWHGTRYEILRAIYRAQKELDKSLHKAKGAKLSSLNRLERSLLHGQVAAVAKDTTVNVVNFLTTVWTYMEQFLTFSGAPFEETPNIKVFRGLQRYLELTMQLCSASDYNDVKFWGHLEQGKEMLSRDSKILEKEKGAILIKRVTNQLEADFGGSFHLGHGDIMEPLWEELRPTPYATEDMFLRGIKVQQLAARFDDLRWKSSAPLDSLVKAQKAFILADSFNRGDTKSVATLVDSLAAEVESLEVQVGTNSIENRPYFSEAFSQFFQSFYFCPSIAKDMTRDMAPELALLSDTPTRAVMVGETYDHFVQAMEKLMNRPRNFWDGTLATSLWNRIQGSGSVALRGLAMLESELPILGEAVTFGSILARAGLQMKPQYHLLHAMRQLLEAYKINPPASPTTGHWARGILIDQILMDPLDNLTLFSGESEDLEEAWEKAKSKKVRDIAIKHFTPVLQDLGKVKEVKRESSVDTDTAYMARAWMNFTIGILKLWVTDKLFDPQVKRDMERDFALGLLEDAFENLNNIETFEDNSPYGQELRARKNLLQNYTMLLDSKETPDNDEDIYRPEKSELPGLQSEFAVLAQVLKTCEERVKSWDPEVSLDGSDEGLELLEENARRLITRLSTKYEAYEDLTQPTIYMLRCLQVALSYAKVRSRRQVITDATTRALQIAPFALSRGLPEFSLVTSSQDLYAIDYMALVVAIEGLESLGPDQSKFITQCFHRYYQEWDLKLEADRKADQAKRSLYHFRGSAEDEEELDEAEFNELFPTEGDGENVSNTKKADQVRNLSLKVAKAHKKIFSAPPEPATAMMELARAASDKLAEEVKGAEYIADATESIWPSIIFLLDERREEVFTSEVGKSYNFYLHQNLAEARRLVSMVQKVRSRFRELQMVDEIGHMQPLEDVVQSCDALLDLTHSEPLAKILPKLEHLHGFVYEWQFGGWASKVYGVPELHESLTDTIIRWRRLELSTWANLFDMEMQKCADDAYSWWFIAYQVVIEVPLSLVADKMPELIEYTPSMIQNLEEYFTTSMVGQFAARLALLRQLHSHLKLLQKSWGGLSIVVDAVENFLGFYTRFEKPALEAIHKGRIPIEKSMKDVVLVASWKDTNITALRESARRSHMKLFRLVRKFRAVLGQDMKHIIQQGLPVERVETPGVVALHHTGPPRSLPVDMQNVVDCLDLEGWLESNPRVRDGMKTASIMARIGAHADLRTEMPAAIDSFISSLNESMAELRKETPTALNDETKDKIKHLKTRKRKLFADTLKELRRMGIKYNLSLDKLASQKSLATTFTSAAPLRLDISMVRAADYYFHKTLDLVPKARLATQEHSEDLTGAEVARSIGFVEGLIHLMLEQRKNLAATATSWDLIQQRTNRVRDMLRDDARCMTMKSAPTPIDSEYLDGIIWNGKRKECVSALKWLLLVIDVGLKLVQAQARLSNGNYTAATELLQKHASILRDDLRQWELMGPIPEHTVTHQIVEIGKITLQHAKDLAHAMNKFVYCRSELQAIFRHIKHWCNMSASYDTTHKQTNLLIGEFADEVSMFCDKLLVGVELIKKATAKLPYKEDEPGWMLKHYHEYMSMVRDICLENLASDMRTLLDHMSTVCRDSEETDTAMLSVLLLAFPIFDQFTTLTGELLSRLLEMHRATANMACNLTESFCQLAAQGFCGPQEKSDETSGDKGNLESGTGLGDGQGAEDISKDIKPDEDLSELAQEANKEKNEDMEDEKDAVDMADEELEGDMGSVAGEDEEDDKKEGDEEEDEENEMDEEAGDVDDLDPTAVDEKLWDGKDEEDAEKDQEGDKAKGQKKDDEQMAADDNMKKEESKGEPEEDKKDEDEQPEGEEIDDEKEDVKAQDEMNKQEQTAEEKDTLALPDEMDLDFDEDKVSEDSDDDLDVDPDAEEQKEVEEQEAGEEEQVEEDDEKGPDEKKQQDDGDGADEPEDEADFGGDEVDENPKEEKEDGEEEEESAEKEEPPAPRDDTKADQDQAAPSDVKSSGQDQNGEAMDLDDELQASAAQQDEGEQGQGQADKDASVGEQGVMSRKNEGAKQSDEAKNEKEAQEQKDPFKKLGDALERWHRQQQEIEDAMSDDGDDNKHQPNSEDQGHREFQHLRNDDDAEEMQAMGGADNDQVQPIDESMAIDQEDDEDDATGGAMDGEEDEKDSLLSEEMDSDTPAEAESRKEQEARDKDDVRSGVKTRQGNFDREETPGKEEDETETAGKEEDDEDENMDETSMQLSATHLSAGRELRDFGECMRQWAEFQAKTHALSLSLTSQLRLILTPSQSTKLSGSFRTGKRLNIKRIIPYIASSYKRDKIWMRRAIPTKRTYQILLCVDDSLSMGGDGGGGGGASSSSSSSSSGTLAMESLVMVSRSLTMLEAGQVGVVGFGSDVFTAHALTDPFGADAGAKVLQNFTFRQDRTDIAQLIRRTIDTFREARQQQGGGSGSGSDLWQLALIMSDGLTPSSAHDAIRRLLREAMEERIMVVFIVMDDTGKKKGDSVLDLKEARFVADPDGGGGSRVVIERYLDTFPFQYYLIVHHLEDLPGALAGLLRTWFAEVTA